MHPSICSGAVKHLMQKNFIVYIFLLLLRGSQAFGGGGVLFPPRAELCSHGNIEGTSPAPSLRSGESMSAGTTSPHFPMEWSVKPRS